MVAHDHTGCCPDDDSCCKARAGRSDDPRITLDCLKRGQCARIIEKKLSESDRRLLRAMGLRANARLRLCRAGEPCIVALGDRTCECRIGLARALASRILVAVEA